MILTHAHLGRQITEYVILLLIGSSHAFSYHTRLWIRSRLLMQILKRVHGYQRRRRLRGPDVRNEAG